MKRQHITISLTAAELRALLLLATLGIGDLEGDETYSATIVRAAERAKNKVAEVAHKNSLEPY